ncbi:hypothetical protein [Arthrobacter sp. JSM 101049]|uniref:hypothetical protein n=1 Tax=Arthrobacter sp. JSM 101049 TaxID=929097 RepID=UPI003562F662
MDRADLEQAVQLATDTERMAAAEYRAEIAQSDADGNGQLSDKGREWVIAFDELAAARDELEADQR